MSSQRLVDYLILVGPSTEIPSSQDHEAIPGSPVSPTPSSEGWSHIFKPSPAILRRYPAEDRADMPLSNDIICFCQPEGCFYEITEPSTHLFMLTKTETNEHTYGICMTFPHLVDPVARAQSPNWSYENGESVSVEEWGVLTVCILSGHQFFGLFERCLRTLVHFVEHFGGTKLSWDLLIHAQFIHSTGSPSDEHYLLVREVERWIERLISLPAPKPGAEVLEIELEVDPASTIGYPPSSRLPVADIPIHSLFTKLDVNLIIETYRLLLTEQKVIIHSKSFSLSAQFVLMLQCLLYPLQYLFPIVPLLPTSMPKAENLLMVPTPFIIGVCSSFLKKLSEFHRTEIWLVDLDEGKVHPPTQVTDPPNFPLSVLQLQADIRLALDRVDGGVHHYPGRPTPYVDHVVLDGSSFKDDVDVLIRIAFVEFLMGPDMLGHVESHTTIYRLFPRPVVSLRKSSFMSAYISNNSDSDTTFISNFIQSQSLEYFLEWVLNPNNTAFEEIRRGFMELERVGDKMYWWIQHSRPPSNQMTLYNAEEEPLLYQEMLNHKASQAVFLPNDSTLSDDDDSDFEILGQEYYDGGSEVTSSEDSRACSREGGSQVVAAEVIEFKKRRFFHRSSSQRSDLTSPLKVMVDLEMMELPVSQEKDADHDTINIDKSLPASSQQPLPPNHDHAHKLQDFSSQPLPSADDSVDEATLLNDNSAHQCLPSAVVDPASDTKETFHTPGIPSSHSMPMSLSELIGRGLSSSPEGSPEKRHSCTPTVFLTPRSSLPSDLAESLTLDKGVVEVEGEGALLSLPHDPQTRHSSSLPRTMAGSASMEFSTPRALPERREDEEGMEVVYQFPPSVVRSVPWSAVSTLHEMEQHIKELVGRIGSGQGLPWPKPQYFKKILSEEKSRVALLRRLELRLGIREQTEMLLSVQQEIKPVVVSKAVYRGVLELLKYLLVHIEADISRNLESPIFSVFLLFRLALCLCMDTKGRYHSQRTTPTSRSRSSYSPRTPSPDSVGEQWSRIINLFSDSPPSAKAATKGSDRSEEMRENKSTGITSSPEERDSVRKTNSREGRNEEETMNQESLGKEVGEAEAMKSPTTTVATVTDHIDSPQVSAENCTIKPKDLTASDDKATPTNPTQTPPIGKVLKRVRTLTDIEVGLPKEGAPELIYLHVELSRSLGNDVRDMMFRKNFWTALFASVVTADRRYLGWNENTMELYDRYNSMGKNHRSMFAYKEDILLSTVLHNLLVFMLMVGVSPEDAMDMCHRLSARVRLATFEERLLQQTLAELEKADSSGARVDMRDLAMMALYSETQPVVMFIVHHGIDVTAPVYKLQITDEVCILRRFPDDKITCRFWNTLIHNITCNDQRMTVSFSYQDKAGEYFHHFHSKQYTELFICFLNLKLIATRNLRSVSLT